MTQRTRRVRLIVLASLVLHVSAMALALSFGQNAQPATITVVTLEASPPKGTATDTQKAGTPVPPTETPKPAVRKALPAPKQSPRPVAKAPPTPTRKEPVVRQAEPRQVAKATEPAPDKPAETVQPSPVGAPAATAATTTGEPGNALVGQGHKDGVWKEVDIYAADDPQWSAYFDIVRKRIKEKFRYPPEEIARGKSGGTLMVRFGIRKGGELAFTEVMRTSGNEALDRNAVEAIRQAAPFPRLPQENVQGINVPMDMDYILHK